VIPAEFAYSRPASVEEAIGLLSELGSEAKLLAGGQSLLPLLKLRLARADRLIDIGRLRELRGIRRLDDGSLAVGALTTYRDLLDSPDVMRYGLMRDAIPGIADVQVRNRGTVGGAIAHADPASDLPAVLLALGADVALRSSSGERRVAMADFLVGAFESVARPDELLTEVILPAPRHDAGSAYRSLEQPASGYSLVGVAAIVFASGDVISGASVALTGVSDTAYRASAVEEALTGARLAGADLAGAASHATDGRTVNSDIHADAEYRAAMAVVHTRRALEAAIARLG
jgi:carbon-monoxide dehydrogenase medium subunit